MDRLLFDDVELTFDIRGGGEPVVLVHAAPFVSWYEPLVHELSDYEVLTYRRRLIRSSDDAQYRPLSVAEDAATCLRLMDHVGWEVAHVAGHSYGALVALQLGLDAPRRTASIALLEPAASGFASPDKVAAAVQPLMATYRSGDVAGAVDAFLIGVCGQGYRHPLEQAVPGAFDEAVAQADLFFQSELAAVRQLEFGPAEAARIVRPILDVLGTETAQRFVDGSQLIRSWFPEAEHLPMSGAGHLLMVQDPQGVAAGLREFWKRHPIDTRPA